MSTDRPRHSHDTDRSYKSVVAQQGRVAVEEDPNEVDELRGSATALDYLGPAAATRASPVHLPILPAHASASTRGYSAGAKGEPTAPTQPLATDLLVDDGRTLVLQIPGPDGTEEALKIAGTGDGGRVTRQDLEGAKKTVEDKLDRLRDIGEQEALRVQLAMDRLAKLMATLWNLLEKASDTASGITQNIK